MAMELIIQASRWVVGREHLKKWTVSSSIRVYIDDMTTLTTTKACTKRLFEKLQGNIQWARIKIKHRKSRSISTVKGRLANKRFHINDEKIPTVVEKPIKKPGTMVQRKNTERVQQLGQDTINKLQKGRPHPHVLSCIC